MRTVPVNQTLDRKLTLLGFEVVDLLAIFILLSTLNLFFGQTGLRVPFVWLPTIGLVLALRYGKRGKPEKYLLHWFRFQAKPGVLSAFAEPTVRPGPIPQEGRQGSL